MPARAVFAAFVFLLMAGCTRQAAPGVYRLVDAGPARILVPPGVSDPALSVRTFNFPIGKRVLSNCRTHDVFRVDSHRDFLRITVQREALLAHTGPWLVDWTAAFELKGCVEPGESMVLAEQIVESVPMDSARAYGLLHPDAVTSGYIDLVPGYRLKLVSPILRDGAPAGASAIETESVSGNDARLSLTVKTSADFLGYEVSWYVVQADGKLTFATGESHIGSQVTNNPTPRVNHFAFPAAASCYRFFYLIRKSQTDHNVAVLAASSRAELNRQTPAFSSDPEACAKAPPQTCVGLPAEVGVTIYFAVTANGAPVDVPIGATIADALRVAGVRQPASVLASLTVRRNYKGAPVAVEFDRSKPDILALKLKGHEDLRW